MWGGDEVSFSIGWSPLLGAVLRKSREAFRVVAGTKNESPLAPGREARPSFFALPPI